MTALKKQSNTSRARKLALCLLALALFLSACDNSTVVPDATNTLTPPPSASPLPWSTPTITPSPTPPSFVTGGTLAYLLRPTGNSKTTIALINVLTGENATLDYDCYSCAAFSFAPDGTRALLIGAREFGRNMKTQVLLVNVADASLSQPPALSSKCQDSAAFSPDGKYLLYTNSDRCPLENDIEVMELATHKVRQLTDSNGRKYELAWSPNGRYIAYGYVETVPNGKWRTTYESVWLMDADGKNRRQIANMPLGYQFQLSWSPDSTSVAFASPTQCGDIYTANLTSNYARHLFRSDGCATNPIWSSDGKALAVLITHYDPVNHQVQDWNISLVSADGRNVFPIVHGDKRQPPPLYLGWLPANSTIRGTPSP